MFCIKEEEHTYEGQWPTCQLISVALSYANILN